MVEQNLFVLAAKVEFVKMRTLQEKASAFPGLQRQSQTSKPSEPVDVNMEKSYLRVYR